jgi:hypothetical protein
MFVNPISAQTMSDWLGLTGQALQFLTALIVLVTTCAAVLRRLCGRRCQRRGSRTIRSRSRLKHIK